MAIRMWSVGCVVSQLEELSNAAKKTQKTKDIRAQTKFSVTTKIRNFLWEGGKLVKDKLIIWYNLVWSVIQLEALFSKREEEDNNNINSMRVGLLL